MRHLSIIIAVISACTLCFAGENLLTNPDFATTEGWVIPNDSGWSYAGGPESALFYAGGTGRAVQQTVQFVTPNAEHQVRARLRSDGTLRPIVRVVEVATGTILAHLTARPEEGWQELSADFAPPSADLQVMIFPHPAAAEELPVPVGEARVAEVTLAQTGPPPAMEMPDIGENIALGRPYTMEPAPRYSYTTDPGDATQLTDGEFSTGYFWTQEETVGWGGKSPKFITIDLGEDQPIRALSFRTAAGAAGVQWPASILIYVSIDGQRWHETGDLVKMHTDREQLPEEGVYAVRRIWADGLDTHGAHVKLAVEPDGSYTFCDEIEVFRGDEALLAKEFPGEGVEDVADLMEQQRVMRLIREQFQRDLDPIGEDIRALERGQRQPFEVRAQMLAERIDEMEPIPMDDFVAILPMTDLERDIFRLQADVWRAQGKDEVRLWDMHRWDPLAPSQEPDGEVGDGAVEIAMMQNENRADVFNITNASERDIRVRLTLSGVPDSPNPDWLAIHEVQHVGTRWFTSVAAALPVADRAGDAWLIDVPSGMTRQVWVAANRPQMEAGTYEGEIELRSVGGFSAEVPLRLEIYPLRFPDQVTLNTGGWAYTDAESRYGVTSQNRAALVEHLKEHYVNAPWATGASIRGGTFDDEGNVIEEPDTTRFDDWVALWPDAKIYLTFPSVGTSFGGAEMGTEVFKNKVGAWAKFWSDHMESLGKRPDQLGMLLVDEPHSQEQYETITAWARAIKAAAPGIVIWEDPQPQSPDPWVVEMFEVADVICPLRSQYLSRPDWYREMLAERQQEGAELWFYSANGPARTFDPYSYYLMQAWHALEIGGLGSNFWAFGDTGGVSCWNEYPAAGNGPYTPSYVDATSVTTAKYMEAIREGIEDFEYVTMLRERVEELEREGAPAARLARARELLDTAAARVATVDEYEEYRWDVEKDRSVQDAVRLEVLGALVDLR
ncbi:MAG: discoidin domain-containing protein [Armatimonadota bacterium]